ncbi:unnamed protein product [Adineta steineri]|uniref:Uncharacterized protein n=1 Tax=Adineta steineri TaxID=433720 RepID=A0A819VFP2_9BILA|nr:unnamed protein product [Adineta steineri]
MLGYFSHIKYNRKKQKQKSTPYFIIENVEKEQLLSSYSSIYHIFSPPLKICMLRKIRCRIQPQTSSLSVKPFKQQSIVCLLNESQNCFEKLPYQNKSSINHLKKYPSLIAIDIDNNDLSQEQFSNFHSSREKSKSMKEIQFYRKSIIKLANSDTSQTVSSHYCQYSSFCIQKQKSDSIIYIQQRKHTLNHLYYFNSKQRSFSNYSSHNTNSTTYDSPVLSETIIDTSNSDSEISTLANKKSDKTSRLKIHDDLNKDGSRHFVMHKDSEESIRKRRDNKRMKRSEEKKRKIKEKISKANERWQKYSNIDYELVFFISRYYDQLPLCLNCRNYFITHQTQFLAEDPRASLDYAADAIIKSSNDKTITMKQAAKARLIKDYDKQTDIIFHLCDSCLTKCEQIRNELKQIRSTQKMSNELNSPNTNIMPMVESELHSQQHTPSSPSNIPTFNNQFFPSIISSPLSSSPSFTTNLGQQEKLISPPFHNTMTNMNQVYMNNLIQYHQIKLEEFYQQSQHIILTQQNYPSTITDQQQLQQNLQSCIQQMQYHYLEILHLQYPNYSLSFPYLPSYNVQNLSYRHQQIEDNSESCSSTTEKSDSSIDNNNKKYCSDESHINEESNDDRLTIKTCHGFVEYCNDNDSEEDLKSMLRRFDNREDLIERRREHNANTHSVNDLSERGTYGAPGGAPLLNITVHHRGFYYVSVKINYLRNGIQDEYETDSFFDGTNKVFPLQKDPADDIKYVRIRFHVSVSDDVFGDFQILDPKGAQLCFVLSGTIFSPVYSICAKGEDYSGK